VRNLHSGLDTGEYDFIHLKNGAVLTPQLGYKYFKQKLQGKNPEKIHP